MFNINDILASVVPPSMDYMNRAIPVSWNEIHLPYTPKGLNLADLAKVGMLKTAMRTRQMPWDVQALGIDTLSSALGQVANANLAQERALAIPTIEAPRAQAEITKILWGIDREKALLPYETQRLGAAARYNNALANYQNFLVDSSKMDPELMSSFVKFLIDSGLLNTSF